MSRPSALDLAILDELIQTHPNKPMILTGSIIRCRRWLLAETEAAEQSESEAAAVDREDLKERSRLSADHDASR